MIVLIILAIIFAYLVIGVLIDKCFGDDDISVMLAWPLFILIYLAIIVGGSIYEFFDEKKWKKGDKE